MIRCLESGSYNALFYFVASHEDCACRRGLSLIEMLNYNHRWKKEKYFDVHVDSPKKLLTSA